MTTQPHNPSWFTRVARRAERGASLVEYAFLLALIAIVCIVAIRFLGGETSQKYSEFGDSVAEAGS